MKVGRSLWSKSHFALFLGHLVIRSLVSNSYASGVDPCKSSLHPFFGETNLLFFFYLCFCSIRSLPIFTQGSANEGLLLNSSRLYHNDLSSLHAQWFFFPENSHVSKRHNFLLQKPCWSFCKRRGHSIVVSKGHLKAENSVVIKN